MIPLAAIHPEGYGFTGLDLGLLILRLAVGSMIFIYGVTHVWGRERVERTAAWLEANGLEQPRLQAVLLGSAELLSGLGLLLGLLNPLAAAGTVGVCGVYHVISGSYRRMFTPVDRAAHDHVVPLVVVALALGATGPGRWSVDRLLNNELYGLLGFVITVLIGVGTVLVILVGFWQPAKARRRGRDGSRNRMVGD